MYDWPILIDETSDVGEQRAWRAVDQATVRKLRGKRFRNIRTAIERARATQRNGTRRVALCPMTRTGRDHAARAAAGGRNVIVTGYQVWIIEASRATGGARPQEPWLVQWYGRNSSDTKCWHERRIDDAVQHIRKRRANAPIRVVTNTREGQDESIKSLYDPNTVGGPGQKEWP